mgnify:CR=1 FL=1
MPQKSQEEIIENIRQDLERCGSGDVKKILSSLSSLLKKYDRDKWDKNWRDFFKRLFKGNREKCILMIEDLLDSEDKLSESEKTEMRKDLLATSEIYMTILEKLKALFGAM